MTDDSDKHKDDDRRQGPFHIIVDHKPHDWNEPFITGADIKRLAGVDPATFSAWQDVPGPEDLPIGDNDKVDLRKPGTEKFFTGKKATTEGLTVSFLPPKDHAYLTGKGIVFEEVQDGAQKGLILKNWPLPPGKFDATQADVLILLPSGYADVPPDMFHLVPWVKLTEANRYPRQADSPVNFAGKSWQRWSRHNSDWRPGIDGIWTMIQRVVNALREAG